MQQRVAIARATVHSPRLVLADEPYSGLDDSGARALTTMLQELRDSGTAIIVVTHNIQEGLSVATHAAVMARGRFMRFETSPGLDAASYSDAYRQLIGVPAA
jgi:ABC-type multidrug transport system ATPase subunit